MRNVTGTESYFENFLHIHGNEEKTPQVCCY